MCCVFYRVDLNHIKSTFKIQQKNKASYLNYDHEEVTFVQKNYRLGNTI